MATWASRPRRLVAPVALIVAFAVGCGSGGGELVARAGGLSHVHDLVVDAEGSLVAATHTGLYRIEGPDRAVLEGTEQHDLMAMTGLDNGDLVASGHPDLRLDQYRVEGLPPFLGLATSIDGGESWDVVDLLGEADFHTLVATDEGIYAAESAGFVWLLDLAGGAERLGAVGARDLAVEPGNTRRQVATDFDAGVWVSDDAARTWSEVEDAPALVEIEWSAADRLLGIDVEGMVWSASAPGEGWTELTGGPPGPQTFVVDRSGSWWVASEGEQIWRTDDDGGSWVEVYAPPTPR